jgi:hypothetical protein
MATTMHLRHTPPLPKNGHSVIVLFVAVVSLLLVSSSVAAEASAPPSKDAMGQLMAHVAKVHQDLHRNQMTALGPTTCACENSKKRDCGFPGIEKEGCEEKGCCWDPNQPSNWCYFQCRHDPNAPAAAAVMLKAPECRVDSSEKLDCGFPGIDQLQCEEKDCCWDDKAPALWCYRKKEVTV